MTAALAGYLAITQLAQHLDLTLPTSICLLYTSPSPRD